MKVSNIYTRYLIVGVVLITAWVLVFPSVGTATEFENCSLMGLFPGACGSGACGATAGCDCTESASPHLCCRATVSSEAPVDKCFEKATGSLVGASKDVTADLSVFNQSETEKISFIPQISLPGSKFIAGEEIIITGLTLGEWISAAYVFFVSVAGILATVMMMWGGMKYVISMGSPEKMSDASDQIVSAMIGLALALGAYVILLTINPALVQFKDLSIRSVPAELAGQDEEETAHSIKGPSAVPWTGQDVQTYDSLILTAAAKYSLDARLVKAIMLAESSGRPDVVSPAGACGLMQLLPSTAGISCDALKDPKTNIEAGARYLRDLTGDTCPTPTKKDPCPLGPVCKEGDMSFVIAAYNGGQGANKCSSLCPGQTWWQCVQNSGYAETRTYVPRVLGIYERISF